MNGAARKKQAAPRAKQKYPRRAKNH